MTAFRSRILWINYLHKKRAGCIFGALVLIFGSAYAILGLLWRIGAIGGWQGMPQYAAQMPILERQATWYQILAVVLLLLAALLLNFATVARSDSALSEFKGSISYAAESTSEKWSAPPIRYLLCLSVSLLATLVCVLLLHFIGPAFFH